MAQKWKNAWVWILLFCLVTSASVAAYTLYYPKDRYKAEYTLLAAPANEGVAPLEASRMLVRDMAALMQSERFYTLRLNEMEDHSVAVRGEDGTHLVHVEATTAQADTAQLLANTAGEELLALLKSEGLVTACSEISRAALPSAPMETHILQKAFLSFLLAFTAGSLCVFLFGSDRKPLYACEYAQSGIPFPLLGAIADERADGKRFFKKKKKNRDFGMLYEYMKRLVSDNVRTAVLGLRIAERGKASHSVVLTSIGEDEGKTMLAALLSCELAWQGFRTLLIDLEGGDKLNQMLAARGRADLIDYLSGEAELHETVIRTSLPNLSFIDYQHQTTQEVSHVAATGDFVDFLQNASKHYDFILLNAEALNSGSSAAMLGAISGATLLIASDGRYSADEVNAFSGSLSTMVNRLCGIVLTRVSRHCAKTPLHFSRIRIDDANCT
ncbi:MAG: hypothetical protein RR696_07350 [Clostridia bacterium]